jgi:hypothetical protein
LGDLALAGAAGGRPGLRGVLLRLAVRALQERLALRARLGQDAPRLLARDADFRLGGGGLGPGRGRDGVRLHHGRVGVIRSGTHRRERLLLGGDSVGLGTGRERESADRGAECRAGLHWACLH